MKAANYSFDGETWSKPFIENTSENIWVVLFGDKQILESKSIVENVRAAFPNALITGCSSAGEIDGVEVKENTVSVMVMEFEKTKIKSSCISLSEGTSSLAAGEKLASELNSEDLVSIFIISDGLNVNGTALVNGLRSVVKDDVVLSGGLAGDGDRFGSTCVIYGDDISDKKIIAVGLYGSSVEVSSAAYGGWQNFGPERKISKSKENVLFELDGRPALDVYKEYLGEAADQLPSSALLYPLSIKKGKEGLVRTVLSVCEKTKSMTFAGDVPEGFTASLMHAKFESLVDGAATAYEEAKSNMNCSEAEQVAALAVSCVGRKLVMGSRVEDETEIAESVLECKFVQSGFYSYGEIGAREGESSLHNQTYSLTLIKEGA